MKKVLSVIFISAILAALLVPLVSATSLPDWYPDDVSNFVDFHGADLPRVVDDAGIFTPSEEAALTSQINEFIAAHDKKYDFVIFTDVTNYGIGRGIEGGDGVYPADFYQFNGYGFDDDYSGSVLFICMEPGNRYWWSAARGKSQSYFTYSAVNSIDDKIEPYMINGSYYEAMRVYIETLDELYSNESKSDVKSSGTSFGIFTGAMAVVAIIAVVIVCVLLALLLIAAIVVVIVVIVKRKGNKK